MNKKRKIIFTFVMLFALFTMFGNLVVNATSEIVFVENDNPDFVTVLSLNDESYKIEIDEETQVGYVVKVINGEKETLGTCQVVVINKQYKDCYTLCYSINETNLGQIIITSHGDTNIVSYVDGSIEDSIDLYSIVTIIE